VNVRFHPQASSEFADAVDYYERQRRGLGRELAEEVKSAVRRISDAPGAWALVSPDDGIRRCQAHRFPYGLFYRIEDDGVAVVFAVAHLRRRPGYWRDRL